MGSIFKFNFVIKEKTNLSEFINYKLDENNNFQGETIIIEQVSSNINELIFKKITKTYIDLPKLLTDIIGFKNLDIIETITITDKEYKSIIHSPPNVSDKLKFVEEFTCVQLGEHIVCTINVIGTNYLASPLKKMAENIYTSKRKHRLSTELKKIKKK
jgi:predicted nuclease with TOPRIM domain